MGAQCSCGGPLLALLTSGQDNVNRFVGQVCAHCREETWIDDPRDANLECRCDQMDDVFIRWYGRRLFVGYACVAHHRAVWNMDEPGAELHEITYGISTVIRRS